MHLYYWKAISVIDGEEVYGVVAAHNEGEAIEILSAGNWYRDTVIEREAH